MSDEEYTYLELNKTNTVEMPKIDRPWAQIAEDGSLEFIDWDIINSNAARYDENKNRSQTEVFCKLLVLVREQAKKEAAHE